MASANPNEFYVIKVFELYDGYYVYDHDETTTIEYATRFTLQDALNIQNEFADETGIDVQIVLVDDSV